MLKTLIIIPIGLALLSLSACTSKPREVSASIPLVSKTQTKPDKQEVPSEYWSQLSDPNQNNVQHAKYNIKLSNIYISALGQTCRELSILDKGNDVSNTEVRRTACEASFVTKDDETITAWFLEKKIIESSVYVEL